VPVALGAHLALVSGAAPRVKCLMLMKKRPQNVRAFFPSTWSRGPELVREGSA